MSIEQRAESRERRAENRRFLLLALSSMLYALSLWFAPLVYAEGSRYYLIEGVHYLMNEGDRDTAEEFFRKAILSSSFNELLGENDAGGTPALPDVAEAFYFLGRIYYERAILDTGYSILDTGKEKQESGIQHPASSIENITWAKKYLRKAEEYGIVYDRLHPPLLDAIVRKFPEMEVPVPEPSRSLDKAKVIIEIGHGSYQINAIKIDKYTDITRGTFSSGQMEELECGARYKMMPDIQGRYRSMYRALVVLGIGLTFWLTRG